MFTERERLIFGPYPRGDGVTVYADPLRVRRRLRAYLDGDPQKAVLATKSPVPELAVEAMERVIKAAVLALDMIPFDPATGRGADEGEVVAALNAYLDWEEAQKKTGETSPTCSPPTAAPPSPYWTADDPPGPAAAASAAAAGPTPSGAPSF